MTRVILGPVMAGVARSARRIALDFEVEVAPLEWELTDEKMPESVLHDEAVALLVALLSAWAAKKQAMRVARNLAVRWEESRPNVGVDPDVAVLWPAPPDVQSLKSIRTWQPDHRPPILAIEVVSESDPHKDYSIAPEKYARSGVGELWIFDPLLVGPSNKGGPFRIQVWRRNEEARFERLYAGEGPTYSPTVDGYLVAVDEGRRLRIAAEEAATDFWLTAEEAERAAKEAERAAKEAERAAKEAERAAKEAALARVAELEAEVERLKQR